MTYLLKQIERGEEKLQILDHCEVLETRLLSPIHIRLYFVTNLHAYDTTSGDRVLLGTKLHVCMCVFMYVRMCICMYGRTYVCVDCMYFIYVCIYLCIYVYVHVKMYVGIYA